MPFPDPMVPQIHPLGLGAPIDPDDEFVPPGFIRQDPRFPMRPDGFLGPQGFPAFPGKQPPRFGPGGGFGGPGGFGGGFYM